MHEIIVDCTELYLNPARTGVQRVVRQLLRHWPISGPELHLARFDGQRLVPLSSFARRLLTDEVPGAKDLSRSELVRLLTEASAEPVLNLPLRSTTLIPEVFFDPTRATFHIQRARIERIPLTMLAFDFLPFLRPELSNIPSVVPLMHYIRAIREASSVAHVSAQTARNYAQRIMRDRGPPLGPVLPLGANGLALEKQQWRTDRTGIVALGSIDGRKNQDLIVAAFIQLWKAGHRMPLVLIGQTVEHVEKSFLREALDFPQFRWLDKATDAEINDELRQARATIYVSSAEGFGLPPVESLAAGIPVIASTDIPSLTNVSARGQLRLAEVSADTIAEAVIVLNEDAAAAALWTDAESFKFSTWAEFSREAARWLTSLSYSERP